VIHQVWFFGIITVTCADTKKFAGQYFKKLYLYEEIPYFNPVVCTYANNGNIIYFRNKSKIIWQYYLLSKQIKNYYNITDIVKKRSIF